MKHQPARLPRRPSRSLRAGYASPVRRAVRALVDANARCDDVERPRVTRIDDDVSGRPVKAVGRDSRAGGAPGATAVRALHDAATVGVRVQDLRVARIHPQPVRVEIVFQHIEAPPARPAIGGLVSRRCRRRTRSTVAADRSRSPQALVSSERHATCSHRSWSCRRQVPLPRERTPYLSAGSTARAPSGRGACDRPKRQFAAALVVR